MMDGVSPSGGASGRKLLSESAAATVEAPRVAATAGDMRTECDNGTPHQKQQQRRRRRRQVRSGSHYSSSPTTTTTTIISEKYYHEERQFETHQARPLFASSSSSPKRQSSDKQVLYSPIKARLACSERSSIGLSPSSDYYSSSPAQNSPQLSRARKHSQAAAAAAATTIYENPIHQGQQQEAAVQDDATRMMINSARQQTPAANGNGQRTGTSGLLFASSSSAVASAAAATRTAAKGRRCRSNYLATDNKTTATDDGDDIHAGSTCDSSSHSSSTSSFSCSAAAAASAATAAARKQKARRTTNGEQEHLVVTHSSADSNSTTLSSSDVQVRAKIPSHSQPANYPNLNTTTTAAFRKVNEEVTESDQRYNFVATAMREQQQQQLPDNNANHDDDNNYYYNAARSYHQQRQVAQGQGQRQRLQGGRSQDEADTNYQSPRPRQQLEDDYHLYQVVVPEQQQQQHLEVMAPSPCRSIQRIVQSLFNQNQNQNQTHTRNHNQGETPPHMPPTELSAIPTISDQNLVSNEPLIRSSSWQNKTLIDLSKHSSQQLRHKQQQQQHQRYAQFPPKQQQQPSEQQHLYCGLSTLGRSQVGDSTYKLNSQSFQKLADKQRLFMTSYQPPAPAIQMAPNGDHPYPLAGARSAPLFAAPTSGAGSFSSDSALGFSASSQHTKMRLAKQRRANSKALSQAGSSSSSRFWLLIVFLFGSLALALLALFSTRPTFPQQQQQQQPYLQPSERENKVATQQQLADLYRTAEISSHQNELLFKANQNPPLPPAPSFGVGSAAPSGGALLHYNRANVNVLINNQPPTATSSATTTTTTTTTTTSTSTQSGSTQNYWLPASIGASDNEWCSPQGNECNLRGHCDKGQCYCLAGYSGPTCARVNCPNDCSQRGECKLRTDQTTMANLGAIAPGQTQNDQLYARAYLQSLSYETLASSEASNSICPGKLENEVNQSWAIRHYDGGGGEQQFAYDNRLEWRCQCQAGFAGSDCSQLEELRCDDQIDDDQDGLIDCEDDDCCSQPVCRDNLMCFKSPEPTRILDSSSSSSSLSHQKQRQPLEGNLESPFFSRMKFLIANESVQSYAQEKAFDKSRAALIRGKVVKWISNDYPHRLSSSSSSSSSYAAGDNPIVSVRVSVVESAQFGFTLSRADGLFDMLVNGNEWLTLQFHRNAYAPIKRKVFVRANSINTLDEHIEMALLSQQANQQQLQYRSLELTFGSTLVSEIYRLTGLFKRADEERKRNALFECLINNVQQRAASFKIVHHPIIVQDQTPLLRTIVALNRDAFQTHFDLGELPPLNQTGNKLQLVYNSAMFPPASSVVKSLITIRLLDEQQQHNLEAIYLRLDIEGQSRREHLQPVAANLNYQFAWNRRNVYDQKVYGFGELSIRIGYLYKQASAPWRQQQTIELWRECAQSTGELTLLEQPGILEKIKHSVWSNPDFDRQQQIVWYERKVYLEAHQLNQQADVGKWNLAQSNRLHLEQKSLYFGSGWSLPYQLVYPPTLSEPISLVSASAPQDPSFSEPVEQSSSNTSSGGTRSLARGPNSSMFVIVHNRLMQLDKSGKRRLIDVPLSIITSKMMDGGGGESIAANNRAADFQLIYNEYISTLYVSSMGAGKIVQVSFSSLLVLNKTLSSSSSTSAASSGADTATTSSLADEELADIEPLCGFGRQLLSSSSRPESVRSARQTRLLGPHSMTLDEQHQVLYFLDGSTNLVALDLHGRHATLLSLHLQQRPVAAAAGGANWHPPSNSRLRQQSKDNCRSPMRFAYADFKPHNMHNLIWIKAESSLYFVDQNTVLALRQDYSLEVVAAGPQSPWPASCFLQLDSKSADQYQLGLIKSLVLDESQGELLILHQWTSSSSSDTATATATATANKLRPQKSSGRLYLAKMKLGGGAPRHLFDLHSSAQTWDPMIFALWASSSPSSDQSKAPPINWDSNGSSSSSKTRSSGSSGQSAQTKSKQQQFLHAIGGFKSVDSIEINSDGSIFVLDSGAHQIRLVAPYEPSPTASSSSGQPFDDVNINSRLFGSAAAAAATRKQSSSSRIIGFVNPISSELMEFHADTGIQLSLTSSSSSSLAGSGEHKEAGHFRMDFYYKILANNKAVQLDEDDKNDLDIQRLVINYMTSSSSTDEQQLQFDQPAERQYVRLDKIVLVQLDPGASRRNTHHQGETSFELVRSYTGSRFVLQSIMATNSIVSQRRTICEATNDYLGVLISLKLTNRDYWTELIYDGMTYLIRDFVSKKELASASNGANRYTDFTSSFQDQQQPGSWSQLKRIVYDRVFFHYCNLFVVNA